MTDQPSYVRFLCVAAILSVCTPVFSQSRVPVVLVGAAALEPTPFETRLQSELHAAGFDVIPVMAPSRFSVDDWNTIGARAEHLAIISIGAQHNEVTANLWVTERASGKILFRAVRPEHASSDASAIVALRAVELLRASLLELAEPHTSEAPIPQPPVPIPKPTPVSKSPPPSTPAVKNVISVESKHRKWTIAVGGFGLGGSGGIPTSLAPSVTVGWRPIKSWAAELHWQGPFGASIETEPGNAQVRQGLATCRIAWEPHEQSNRLSPWIAAGFGGHYLHAKGSALLPYTGRSDSAITFVGHLGFGVRASLGKGLYAVPELGLLAAASRPIVRVVDRTFHTGRPFLSGGLSLQYAW